MSFLSEHKKILIYRLEKKGMVKDSIPGFIGTIRQCLRDDPDLSHWQVKERMQFLGWDDVDLDYQTLQLAIACFENDGFKRPLQSSNDQDIITVGKI